MWFINCIVKVYEKLSISFICCVTIVIIFSSAKVWGAVETDQARLRRVLLSGYDRNARPIQNHQNSTLVDVFITARRLEFDEERSILTFHCFTSVFWLDAHMKWNRTDFGNLDYINFGVEELWKPDLAVDNNYGKSDFGSLGLGSYSMQVWDSGDVYWFSHSKFEVGCTSDLRKWPFDTQTCYIVLASWAHDGSQIDFYDVHQMYFDNMTRNREWKIASHSIVNRKEYFDWIPGVPFVDLLITLQLERKSSTHSAVIVVPALAIATAILIVFWIPPGLTERLLVILTLILVNVLYLNEIYISIPNNGDRIPLVLLFYRDSLLMLTVALIWTISLRYLANTKRNAAVPLPEFITRFLDSWSSKVLCLDPRPVVKANVGSDEGDDDEGNLVDPRNPYQEDWAWLAHFLDRIAFVIYLIVYFCFSLAFL